MLKYELMRKGVYTLQISMKWEISNAHNWSEQYISILRD